jgi:hypothetical protein
VTYSWFRGHPETWVPWLRCGFGHGWILAVHDPTAARLAGEARGAFRNPAGPALLDAFRLSDSKASPGMRILMPRSMFDALRLPRATPLNSTMTFILDTMTAAPDPAVVAETQGAIVDLPWWRLVDEPATRIAVWREHEWQAGYGNLARACIHYETTLELLARA